MQIGPTVVMMPPAEHPGKQVYPGYKAKLSKVIGIIQIIIGVLAVLTCLAGAGRSVDHAIAGAAVGVLFIVTGAIAVRTARNKTQCMIIATLVLCISTALLAHTMIDGSVKLAIKTADLEDNWEYDKKSRTYHDEMTTHDLITIIACAIMAVLYLVLFVISIVLAGFSCGAVCCASCCGGKTGPRPQTPPPAYYNSPNQEPEKLPVQ